MYAEDSPVCCKRRQFAVRLLSRYEQMLLSLFTQDGMCTLMLLLALQVCP
jgi:hypothetical protein